MNEKKISQWMKLFLKNEKGSILPLIAVVLILFILIGAYELSSIFVYRDRAVVRDALDSAATSALAAGFVVQSYPTNYSEVQVPIMGSDAKGNPIVIGYRWEAQESAPKKNIYLDRSKAESIAKENFNKVLSGNNIKGSLIDWNFTVTYDDERYLNVTQNRSHTPLAPSWWISSFSDSQPDPWTTPTSNEQKMVRFPRWVKVGITVKYRDPVLMGGVFGKTTQDFSWTTEAVKELDPKELN